VPVVPFSAAPARASARAKPIEVPAADEPWLLMAAATMDAQGRLISTSPEDATDE
jgi:hypothetical protein